MVVGINDYAAFPPLGSGVDSDLFDLLGAVNDAERISAAMRASGVDLPDNRILLNRNATRQAFLDAWDDLIADAEPGDTLIVTFSGHGGQEFERFEPFDEEDGKDETLMFHEFDPEQADIGRLTDDELRAMLQAADDYNIIWVMDSCHSAGLTRSAADTMLMGPSRSGGIYDIPITAVVSEIELTTGDGDGEELDHVTQILGTETEAESVREILLTETNMHYGALSYYFADVLTGQADFDGDGVLTRYEMSEFLSDRVFSATGQFQQPRILPFGDQRPMFGSVEVEIEEPEPNPSSAVPIRVIGDVPPGLENVEYQLSDVAALLTFRQVARGWEVLNQTGDYITTISGGADRLLARAMFLGGLDGAKATDIPPITIEAAHGVDNVPIGESVYFTFYPPDDAHPYLYLFNVASDGTVQYPLVNSQSHNPVSDRGYALGFQVVPPAGVDTLVAVFCSRPPLDLLSVLDAAANRTVTPDLLDALATRICQIDKTGLFTVN